MLVSLNKNSWHSKYYKWINGFYPSVVYKSVCPYFWITVINVIGFPVVVLIKSLSYIVEEMLEMVMPSNKTASTNKEKKYPISSWWNKNETKIIRIIQKTVSMLSYLAVLYVVGYFIFMVYSNNGFKLTIFGILTLLMVISFSFFMGVIASNFFTSDSWKMIKAMFYSFKNKTCPRIDWHENLKK